MKNLHYKIDDKVLTTKVNIKAVIRDGKTGKIKRVYRYHNLIVNTGLNLIAEFIGTSTPSINTLSPNFCAIGTGTNAPAAGNTTLQTETNRTTISSKTSSGNVAYLTGYFGTTDGNGTFREVGLFINGTATLNTGTLFNRSAINIAKSNIETLTIDFTITVS